jgi:hypothetical protein
MTIDSILTEWSYRLPKGYPTQSKDYELLYHVILEMTDLTPLVARNIVNKAQGLTEQNDPDDLIDFTQLGVSQDLIDQIQNRYDNLLPSEQDDFNKNYRKHTIESFLAGGYKPFVKFFNILPIGNSGASMGRGEIQILLAVTNSETGGTATHDIVMPNGEWEVKEIGKSAKLTTKGVLGKEPESKTFRPGKAGMPQQGDLLSKIRDFYLDVVIPYAEMPDAYESLKNVVDSSSHERLQQFLTILDKVFVPLTSKVQEGREISYDAGWQQIYNAFKLMHKVFWETKFDSDIQDTRLTIQTGASRSSYWITQDDYNKIKRGSGDLDQISIHIGEPIENENSNAILWFNRIKRSSFIANPDSILAEFNEIKNKFFAEILGLIAYDTNRPGIPFATTANDWGIIGLSGAQWVFGLRSAYPKYEFIQLQS